MDARSAHDPIADVDQNVQLEVMKLYSIWSPIIEAPDFSMTDPRTAAIVEAIADTILDSLLIDDDPTYIGVWHDGEINLPTAKPDGKWGSWNFVELSTREKLRNALLGAGGQKCEWMFIKSRLTCRAVQHSENGHAMICLKSGDPPLLPTAPELCSVEECSNILIETDWMD